MSLRWKFLFPLNVIILVVWLGHFLETSGRIENEITRSEMDSIGHLALGLKFSIEHMLRHREDITAEQEYLGRLARQWSNLDIMVIDPGFGVRLASNPSRLGRRWHEPGFDDVFAGRHEEIWNIHDHFHDGRSAIDVTIGVMDESGRVLYVVHIARWLDALENAKNEQLLSHLVSALVLLLAVTAAANVLTYRLVIRPIARLRSRIAASGWFEAHPSLAGGGEIEELAAVVGAFLERVQQTTDDLVTTIEQKQGALNEAAEDRDVLQDRVERVTGELADARRRLIRIEKLTAQGQLSAGLAHELRNPLHIIRATAETAKRRHPDTGVFVRDIIEEVDRIEQLIEKLMSYTRFATPKREQIDLAELCSNVKRRICRLHCGHDDLGSCEACTIDIADDVRMIEADPVLLEQAVMNLFTNAVEVTGCNAPVSLAVSSDGAAGIVLTVVDHGPGVAEEDAGHVFEPFFTRKAGGTGLGLSVVQKIADLHDGSITLENLEGNGAIARLHIPACVRGGWHG